MRLRTDLLHGFRRLNRAQHHSQAPHSGSTMIVSTVKLSTVSLSRLCQRYPRRLKVRKTKIIDLSSLHLSHRSLSVLKIQQALAGLKYPRCHHRKKFLRRLEGASTSRQKRQGSARVNSLDIDEQIPATLEFRSSPCQHRQHRQIRHLEHSQIQTEGRMPVCNRCVCRPST